MQHSSGQQFQQIIEKFLKTVMDSRPESLFYNILPERWDKMKESQENALVTE